MNSRAGATLKGNLFLCCLLLPTLLFAQSTSFPLELLHTRLDDRFIPLYLGDTVTVTGVVTVDANRFTPDRTRTFIQDHTGGIQIFSEDSVYALQAGDSIRVRGIVGQFRGLEEVRILHLERLARHRPLPAPRPLPRQKEQFEALEGSLVFTEGAIVYQEAIPRGTYWIVRKGEQSIMVWFHQALQEAIPFDRYHVGDYVRITGILGQYDSYPPYDGNYQIFPRGKEDLTLVYTASFAFYHRVLLFGGLALIAALFWIFALKYRIRKHVVRLRKSSLYHRRLVNLLPEAVLIFKDECIAYANPMAARLLGWQEPGDLVGTHFEQIVAPEDHEEVRRRFACPDALASENPHQKTFVRRDGTRFRAEVSCTTTVFDSAPAMLAICRDITERERHHRHIQELKLFYEQILDELPLELVVFDRHLRFQYISRKAIEDPEKRALALGRTEVEYSAVTGRAHRVALQRQEWLQRVLEEGRPSQFEETLPHPDGPRHYLRFACPVKDAQGVTQGILAYGLDITKRKQMEEALREKQEFLETILQTMGQGLTISDDRPAWIYVNPAAVRILGYERAEDLLGRPFWELTVNPEKARSLWEARKQGQASTYEIEVYDAQGNIRPLLVNATPIIDEQGRVTGSIAVFSDLTERKAYEEKLKLSEARYRILSQLISAYAFGMRFSTDGTLEKLWVTDSVRDVLGYSMEEWFTHDWREEGYLYPEDCEILKQTLGQMLQGDTPLYNEREIRMYTKAGDLRWMHLYVTGEWQEVNGQPMLYLYGGVQDITRQKEVEQELIAAREKAEEMTRLKSAFLANMSHEIRTPLTAIIGFAQILNDEAPEHLKEFSEMIEQGGLRLLDTLNAVLDMSRLESGTLKLAPTPLLLSEEVQDVLALMRPLAQRKNLDLFALLPDEPVWITTDQGCLRRILDNLVGNAIKFTDEGMVQIQVTPLDAEVMIEVLDTGIGISPEFLPHIFEDFRQESDGYTRTHEGSGLGLSITRKLVHLLGGTISVESTKGKGSIFRVILPLTVPEAHPEKA